MDIFRQHCLSYLTSSQDKRTRGNIIDMSATGPCATILSERAALALVAAGAVDEVVVVEEGLRELIKEAAEVPDDTEVLGPEWVEEIVEVETPRIEVVITEVGPEGTLVEVETPGTIEVGLAEIMMGPGPRSCIEVPCARTLPVTMNKMKKALWTEKRIVTTRGNDMEGLYSFVMMHGVTHTITIISRKKK